MAKRLTLGFTAAIVLILPFFIHLSPPPVFPHFNYFLDNLEFTEEALTSMKWSIAEYPNGDFPLESVVNELGLRDQYLEKFESDLEKAQLTDTPHVALAFQDLSENPIRIWIDEESYRIYSTGDDGHSKTGGLDADDIWNGDPDKARAYVHKAYDDWRREHYEKNLWERLIEKIQARWDN